MKLPVDPPLKDSDKPRIRIRGIYTTALTKFFTENGYMVVQPSEVIKNRLSLNETPLSPHIDVEDLPGGDGVRVRCLASYEKELVHDMLGPFDDVIVNQTEGEKGAVYKGIVHRPSPKGGYIVRLTPELEAWLPSREIRGKHIEKGDITVVEVKNVESEIGIPRVSRKINYAGDFAVLLPRRGVVKVSNKLSREEQERLSGLGEVLLPERWGILWRTGAREVGIEKLKTEIDRLTETAEEFKASIKEAPSLTKLRNGFRSMDIFFPAMSKRKLDSIRDEVVPTVEHHHQFKALGEKYALLVDFAENNIAELDERNKTSEMVNDFLFRKFQRTGQELPIYHRKVNGRLVVLGPAKVVESKSEGNSWEYTTFRRFGAGGYYDGIEAPQENGDIGITLIKIGADKLITVYFSVNEELKGIYVNVNTPIELYKDGAGYFDLEIDVVLNKDGDVKIIDRKRLEQLHQDGMISEKLLKWAKKRAKKFKSWLEEQTNEIVEEAERVIKLAQ